MAFDASRSVDDCPEQLVLRGSLGPGWIATQWTPSAFASSHFLAAMLNLIRNPNITSSHLFRADILYDSDADASTYTHPKSSTTPPSDFVRHLQVAYRPLPLEVPGFVWRRTLVRELVPRNRLADSPMVQTCHIFEAVSEARETTLIFYLPHIHQVESMPFYHPTVKGICFAHSCLGSSGNTALHPASLADSQVGVALHLLPFDSAPLPSLQPKITRTAIRLLQTVHKLSQGVKDGYQKRVHHDLVVPQRSFQNTYARLKEIYAKRIAADWREQTDPGKHVFEDLAIAAFLIELWKAMYGALPDAERAEVEDKPAENKFPGFVDIGCGNGLLVHLLRSEGYKGWGFDVRERKSWAMYPAETQASLLVRTLIPSIFAGEPKTEQLDDSFFSGSFEPGTFVISNHADELTAWTPLLAFLSDSPFVAIPCCSHDLAGQRFRAPKNLRSARSAYKASQSSSPDSEDSISVAEGGTIRVRQAAETGSLRKPNVEPKTSSSEATDQSKGSKKAQPSAYAALCNYVSMLADVVGYEPETEMLRIPSTRNACIVGRRSKAKGNALDIQEVLMGHITDAESTRRKALVCNVVVDEMDMPLEHVRRNWLLRAEVIAGKKGQSH